MILSVEIKDIHDMIMLDTIIDMWKDKWKADDAELKGTEDDDAEDESSDSDDESEKAYECMFPETEEEKAHRKALDKLANALRDCGVADVSFTYVGNVHRCKNRR